MDVSRLKAAKDFVQFSQLCPLQLAIRLSIVSPPFGQVRARVESRTCAIADLSGDRLRITFSGSKPIVCSVDTFLEHCGAVFFHDLILRIDRPAVLHQLLNMYVGARTLQFRRLTPGLLDFLNPAVNNLSLPASCDPTAYVPELDELLRRLKNVIRLNIPINCHFDGACWADKLCRWAAKKGLRRLDVWLRIHDPDIVRNLRKNLRALLNPSFPQPATILIKSCGPIRNRTSELRKIVQILRPHCERFNRLDTHQMQFILQQSQYLEVNFVL